MTASKEFFAIQQTKNGQHFFAIDGRESFATREELEKAISQWKTRVTPRMVETTRFEIREDA